MTAKLHVGNLSAHVTDGDLLDRFSRYGGPLLILLTLFAMPGFAATRADPVVVPDNGYANGAAYGKGWDCQFGYRDVRAACVKTIVPANAYLDSRGERWKCERGFRAVDEQCVAVVVPENGYLSDSPSGSGWKCNRGFAAGRDSCVPIEVPANGFLTNSAFGSGWECERGYRAVGTECIAVQVPANAYLVERGYGPGWQCERGYASQDAKTCARVTVPPKAHLSRDGNEWECNLPYRQKGQACVE